MSTEQIVGRLSEMRTSPGAVRWSAMETLGGLTGAQPTAPGRGTLGGAVGGVFSGKKNTVMGSGLNVGLADRQREFGRLLGRQLSIAAPENGSSSTGTDSGAAAGPSVREAAEDLVSIALVQPVLKQIRDGNHLPPPFGPGPAEKQFGTLVDAQWSRSMVKSKNFPLVGAVERYISRANGAVAPAPAPAPAAAAGPLTPEASGEPTIDNPPAGVIAPSKR